MSVDLYFARDSLKYCPHALCGRYQRRIVGLYYTVPHGEADPLEAYRYKGERTADEKLMAVYFPEKANRQKVFLRGVPKELAAKLKEETPDGDKITAWRQLPYSRQVEICRSCPINMAKDDELPGCFVPFSSLPGMSDFRYGFLLTLLYLERECERKGIAQMGSAKREIVALYRLCKGTPIWRLPEIALDCSLGLLKESGMEVVVPGIVDPTQVEERMLMVSLVRRVMWLVKDGNRVYLRIDYGKRGVKNERISSSLAIPFVDEFISKFIYCRSTVDREMAAVLPTYLAGLAAIARKAAEESDHEESSKLLLSFQGKLKRLSQVWQTAAKYDLTVSCAP
jgi:hypothetical protein